MKAFLSKRWFLIVLVIGISLALFQTEVVASAVNPIPPRLVVATTLFLMSWSLESRKLWNSLARPMPAFAAVAISYLFVPSLGWLVSHAFVERDYGIGLLIVTSVPCTIASATIWTRLAGGNEATALLVTMLTTCMSWFATTAWLTWTTGISVDADGARMMIDLILTLVVPVAFGQLARWPDRLRQVAMRGKLALGVVSRLLIFIIILQAVVKAAESVGNTTAGSQVLGLIAAAAASLGIHLTALSFGFFGGQAIGIDRPNRIAVALSGSQKTLPVGLLLTAEYFSDYPLAVVPVLFYHVGQLLVDTFIADHWAAFKYNDIVRNESLSREV